jgi:hypothetical protein
MNKRTASGKAPPGSDGADVIGRIFYSGGLPTAPAGERCWCLRQGQWERVADPLPWPADEEKHDALLEDHGYTRSAEWGRPWGRVRAVLYEGRGEEYVVLMALADSLHRVRVTDAPSLLALLGSLLPAVAADQAIEAREEARDAKGRRRRT